VLKQRVIAALVLIPLVVLSVLYLPTPVFAALMAVFILLGAWEWTNLVPLETPAGRLGLLAGIGGLLFAVWNLGPVPEYRQGILGVAVIWWCLVTCWLLWPHWGKGNRVLKVLVSVVTLVPAWFALVVLHGESPELVLFTLVIIWIADSGAYFSGRAMGRHRLAPAISPGKTWEGVAGGMLGGGIFAGIIGVVLGFEGSALIEFVALCLVVVAVSVVGDLFISLLKRQQGVKDSGHIIPGHGGVLDRIDSLNAAVPVFAAGYGWLSFSGS